MYSKHQQDFLRKKFPPAARDPFDSLVLEDREAFDSLQELLRACLMHVSFEKRITMNDGSKNVKPLVRIAEESGIRTIQYSSDGKRVQFVGPEEIQRLNVVIAN